MRTRLAGTRPSRTRLAPGFVEKRRCSIVASTVALTLSLCGTALAAPMPTSVDSTTFGQRSGPLAAQGHRDTHAAISPRASSESAAPTVRSDDGLGALVIVLISVGGAVALAAAAYTATRFVHRPHPVA
jgi:hypothetical protein